MTTGIEAMVTPRIHFGSSKKLGFIEHRFLAVVELCSLAYRTKKNPELPDGQWIGLRENL